MQSQSSASQNKGLLTTRVLNSLPYASQVKDLYSRTKDSNGLFRFGINTAEYCAIRMTSPFMSKYVALDKFAQAQLEKLESKDGNNFISKSIGVITYPIGYSFGLAKFAKDKVVDIVTPGLEMSYEWADVIVDGLLPPDSDECLEDEYRHMSSLEQKSPFRRIRERATIGSIIHMPLNAYSLSKNILSASVYMSMGLINKPMSKLFHSTTTLIDSINSQFEQHLDHPWIVIDTGDLTQLKRALAFNGAKQVNAFIADIEEQVTELSQYLNQHKLPYNSQAVGYVANKLRDIERRITRIGGIQIESAYTTITTTTPERRPGQPRSRVVSPDEKHHINAHKAELLDKRGPSMIWGASRRKLEAELKQKRAEYLEKPVVTEGEEIPVAAKPVKQSAPKPAPKPEPEPEVEERDPNVDEHGYTLVKAKPHNHHIIPAHVAQELGEQMLGQEPTTPVNSPAEVLNNPFAEISTNEGEVVRGPVIGATKHETQVKEKESKAHEHKLRKKALHQMMREVSVRLKQQEGGSSSSSSSSSSSKSKESLPEETSEIEIEAEVEEESNKPETQLADGWEAPKHPAHIHVEKAAPESDPEVLPAPDNNPFGKLDDLEDDEDPLSMGFSSA